MNRGATEREFALTVGGSQRAGDSMCMHGLFFSFVFLQRRYLPVIKGGRNGSAVVI